MHLLNILQLKRINIWILIISIGILIVVLVPILMFGVRAIFFSIDPDVVYVANALSYIKWHMISYHDHPGVLSIYLFSVVLTPLRIYAKLMPNLSFFDFVFNNYEYIFLYLRLFQSVLFASGIYIFLLSLHKKYNDYRNVVISCLLLLSFMPILYLGTAISAETLSFTLAAIWIYFYQKVDFKKVNINAIILFTVSGLLFANRATNIFYIFASIAILINFKKDYVKNLIFIAYGFIIGLLPNIKDIIIILKRIIYFAGSSGVHGEGSSKILDINLYLQSLSTYWTRDTVFSILIASVFLVLIIYYRKLQKIDLVVTLLCLTTILLFAKFPLAHYQNTNYLFLIAIFSLFYKYFSDYLKLTLIIFLIPFLILNINIFYREIYKEMTEVSILENYVLNNPPQKGEVWEWARSKNFSYIWTNNWGNNVFDEQLSINSIYPLESNVFDKCWDKLYIQEVSLADFKDKYKEFDYLSKKIEGSQNIWVLESNHCFTKP